MLSRKIMFKDQNRQNFYLSMSNSSLRLSFVSKIICLDFLENLLERTVSEYDETLYQLYLIEKDTEKAKNNLFSIKRIVSRLETKVLESLISGDNKINVTYTEKNFLISQFKNIYEQYTNSLDQKKLRYNKYKKSVLSINIFKFIYRRVLFFIYIWFTDKFNIEKNKYKNIKILIKRLQEI